MYVIEILFGIVLKQLLLFYFVHGFNIKSDCKKKAVYLLS